MSYLFVIDEKKKTVLHPYAVKLCPELKGLKEEDILFIVLAFDYHSPYRQFPERTRLVKAMFHVWGDNKPELLEEEDRPKYMKVAIEAYKSLQYNRNQELINTYLKKIEKAQEEILLEDSPTKLKNLREIISGFRKDIRELETEVVEQNILESELKGDRELSLLEQWQSNMKQYDLIRYRK